MYSIRRLLRSATAFSLQQIRRADEAFRIGRDTVLGISNDCVASTKQVAMSDTLSTDPGISVGDVKKVYETEQRMAMKDLVSVKKRIDHHGGEIRNETFGISLFIPPGALAEGAIEVITLTILTEKPASLKLQDDEMIVSCGFKCSPPGLKFLKPVHLTIPHCAVLTDPAEAQTTLYLCDESGLMARQKTSSDTCVARRNQFDVFLTQLSSGWPTIVYKEQFVSHLKILCEVYFPRKVRMDGDALPFEVCLYKDFKGIHETKQYKRHENSVMVEGFPVEFLLSVEDSYTTVKCDAGPFALKRKQQTVDLKELHDMVVEKVIPFSFEVDDKWNSIYSTINMRMIIGTTPGIHTLASLQDGTFRLESEEGKGVINRFAVEPVHPAPSEGKSDSTTSPGYTMSASTTCTREINHRGGELRNETFGISLSIPPGALAKDTSEVITLTILTEKPASLKLQEDDMIVSCGFECSPPGLKFLKPVRLKIPHCAFVFNTSEVEPVLYLGGKDGRMTRQMTPSKSIVAGEASFAVSLKQLSYGWPAIIQNRANMGIVHLQCALYLPRTTRAHGRNTLDVVVYKDIKGLTKTEQYKQDESHLLITEKQFSSSVNVGTDMVVSYGSTEKHMEEKIIHLQEIWHIVSGKVIQIPLDIRDDSLIHLKATAGSIERCEIYMVFESVGIHKDESQADWVQLQRSRRKRIPSSTSSIEYAGAGPCSSSAQDQPLQSGKEPNVGDMMPEDDGQKSHEPDQKNAKDSHRFVEKKIDHDGGELQNETFGTLLFIPPGALAEGTSEVIGLTNLTEKPESLILRRNEMIVSYGYRCSPFGLQFLKPVELTIPHCAVLTDPAKVETALYLSDEHDGSPRLISPVCCT